MSTAPGPTAPPAGTPPSAKREITLVSHSMLFYWWPIWVIGYIFALITYFEDSRLAIVPADTTVAVDTARSEEGVTAYIVKVKEKPDEVPNESLKRAEKAASTPGGGPTFKTRVSQKPWLGPLFCVVLLLTVIITNVPLRGLWSFLVLLLLVMLALIITIVPGGWDHLLGAVGNLHIYINMAGYLFIATAVLLLWAVSVFIFDKRTYMRITPGQIQVCEHIGASIRNFDTFGLSFEKQRDDLFRHWLLGFFSGDLIVRTAGAEKETIRLPNVLWISWRLEEVQRLLREKATVVSG
ncbi:MAG TPA: hypothetical protein VM529_10520 [Gemmata sp.]|nr:hypothetical protein [Gemmata sp.]